MSSSDSSPLSSPPSTDDESSISLSKIGSQKAGASSPPTTTGSSPVQKKRPRPVEPPHEYVLADNADIAFIVMFRSRFADAFPKSLANYGPQDVERGVVDTVPAEDVENLLCALLGLVLNRKKYVERGHYQRALEEAVQTHSNQWPRAWNGVNPLSKGKTFSNMIPKERLTLLRALILWSLSSSEAISAIIKESYKQSRHDDDLNQPLSVQPWGRDGDKRRYWLIEGKDDTHFRLYRESNPALKNHTWWTVAGSIEELKVVAAQLVDDGSQAARRLSEKILAAIPRFEATEEKRRRREYRVQRKAMFKQVEPGLYEGRTRGKRIKYTYSSDEEGGSEGASTRRSTRQSGVSTPLESGPTFTASGRQVRGRVGGMYGETVLSGRNTGRTTPAFGVDGAGSADEQVQTGPNGRPRRSGLRKEVGRWAKGGDHIAGYNSVDEMDDEEEAKWSGTDDYGADDDDDEPDIASDEDNDVSDEDTDMDEVGYNGTQPAKSLIVAFRYGKDSTLPKGIACSVVSPSSSTIEINQDAVSKNQTQSAPDEIADTITVTPFNECIAGITHGKVPQRVALDAEIMKAEPSPTAPLVQSATNDTPSLVQ